jgi:two-component system phosphate regulon sensor histidine kinase PhoR
MLTAFEKALKDGESRETTLTLLGESGLDRTLEVTVRPVPGVRAPGVPAAVGLIRDVTVRERIESMRSQFVADVSHELRTPIAAIRAAVETLEIEGLSKAAGESCPEVARFLAIIGRQARHLQDLVADLTELSQIEVGAVTLSIERLSAGSLLAEVLRDLTPARSAREVECVLQVPEPVMLDGDARRLAQIFRNLVDNAVKFSPQGGRILVSARELDGEALVSVSDSGCGIPSGDREKIFQRFYRVDPSRAKAVPGTGLGLSIVKHLLILHGGRITVDSQVGIGSTFTVHLPLGSTV